MNIKQKKLDLYTIMKVILFLSTFIFFSCSSDVEEKDLSETARSSFQTKRINAIKVEHQSINDIWPQIKTKVHITFQTCLQDAAFLDGVADEDFVVRSTYSDIPTKTNTAGCLQWNETFPFYFLKGERYYLIERKLIGTGAFKGIIPLKIAINPWSNSASDILDLRTGYDETTRELFTEAQMNLIEKEFSVAIDRDNITFNFYPDNPSAKSTVLKFDVKVTPVLVMKDIDQEDKLIRLSEGEFTGRLFFREQLNPNSDYVLIKDLDTNIKSKNNQLMSTLEMELSKAPFKDSTLLVGLDLRSENLPESHEIISQTVHRFSSLNNSQAAIRLENNDLEDLIANTQRADDSREEAFGFNIPNVMGGKGSSVDVNASSLIEQSANIHLEIRNPLSNKLLTHTDSTFEVKLYRLKNADTPSTNFAESEIEEELDISKSPFRVHLTKGTISINPYITYDKFGTRGWHDYGVKVTAVSGRLEGITRMRRFWINPWSSRSDFLMDPAGQATRPSLKVEDSPQLQLANFSWNFESSNIDDKIRVNRFLEFKMEKRFRFAADIFAKGSYEGDSIRNESSINFGDYELTVALMHPKKEYEHEYLDKINIENFHIISASQKDVSITKSGRVDVNLEFATWWSDEIYLNARGIMLVYLKPKFNTDLKPYLGRIPFFNGLGGFKHKLSDTRLSLMSKVGSLGDIEVDGKSGEFVSLKEDQQYKVKDLKQELNALKIIEDIREFSIKDFKTKYIVQKDTSSLFASPYEQYKGLILNMLELEKDKNNSKNNYSMVELSTNQLKSQVGLKTNAKVVKNTVWNHAMYYLGQSSKPGTTLSSAKTLEGSELNDEDIEALLDTSTNRAPLNIRIARKLCALYYPLDLKNRNKPSNKINELCLKQPNEFLYAVPSQHIEKIKKKISAHPEVIEIGRVGLSYSAAKGVRITKAKYKSEYQSQSFSMNVTSGLFSLLGGGVGYYYTPKGEDIGLRETEGDYAADTNSMYVSHGAEYYKNQLALRLIVDIRKCVLIMPKSKTVDLKKTDGKSISVKLKPTTTYFSCDDKIHPNVEIEEKYFYYGTLKRFNLSTAIPNSHPRYHLFNLTIRGEEKSRNLERAIKEKAQLRVANVMMAENPGMDRAQKFAEYRKINPSLPRDLFDKIDVNQFENNNIPGTIISYPHSFK